LSAYQAIVVSFLDEEIDVNLGNNIHLHLDIKMPIWFWI